MSRYFMRETPLSGLERVMMQPPGYRPRGGGIQTGYRYTAADCECKYCLVAERRGCPGQTAAECVCFEERLSAGCWAHGELAGILIGQVGVPALSKRTGRLLPPRTASPFKNQTHCQRMKETIAVMGGESSPCIAAVFLLSADTTLWRKSYPALRENAVNFGKIDVRGIGLEGYTLLQVAKALYGGGYHFTPAELCDPDLIGDELFRLIISAFVIRRYGLPADAL